MVFKTIYDEVTNKSTFIQDKDILKLNVCLKRSIKILTND